MKIKVGINGRHFTLNGKKTQLRMRTSFKWLGWLWHNEPKKAAEWLERVKVQGFHGIRVFGETHWWEGGGFFGLYPSLNTWDLKQKGGSRFKMSERQKELISHAINMLVDHDMIMEYTVIATLKGYGGRGVDPREKEDVVGWNSHALRVTAEYFNEINATNVLPETINEWGAHAEPIPPGELKAEASRWRDRDWPGSPIGISHGGRWNIEYPVGPGGYSHVNIHSPRNGNWEVVGDEIKKLYDAHNKPVYLNENIHYMTEEQWNEWTPTHDKWIHLSTKNAKRVQEQWNNTFEAGASYCLHDIVGMGSDPSMEETKAEKLFREQFGSDGPPPPPPDSVSEFRPHVRWAYKVVLGRDPWPRDIKGLNFWNAQMKAGLTLEALLAKLCGGEEYKKKLKWGGV